MLKVAIIEDEVDAQLLLSSILVEYISDIKIVGISGDFKGSLQLLNSTQPDVVFCDIQLEDCNVFQILEKVTYSNFNLIFTTAYDQFAINAFQHNACHYLLKPFAPNDVKEAMSRVSKNPLNRKIVDELKDYLEREKTRSLQKIAINTEIGIQMIAVNEIIRIEANRSYSTMYFEMSDKLVLSKPLKELEENLPKSIFYRVHASHLININHVKQWLKKDGGELVLSDGSTVPIARRRKKEILNLLLSNKL